MSQFDRECADAVIVLANWDFAKVRDKLLRDIDAHIAEVRAAKLAELSNFYEAKLNHALSGPDEANEDTWPSFRRLYRRETDKAILEFSDALSGFEMDNVGKEKLVSKLEEYARGVVEGKVKEEAGRILIRMKDRFSTLFSHDAYSMPRVWTGKEDIRAITKTARSASLKLLSVMAAIRLDDESDNIEKTPSLALVDPRSSTFTNKGTSLMDPLATSTWDEISPEKTLITPVQCKSLWRQFKTETEYTVTQAIAAQEASKRSNKALPPLWAVLVMIVLGFNEFMTLLRNPLYLGVIFVAFLVFKAVWVQMDIASAFQHGIVAVFTVCETHHVVVEKK